jgi:hypothetical protein
LSFEYDHGGWNNGRLGYECLVVLAHAMGRTLVAPPQQHLYLMAMRHKDKIDKKEHDEMGFLDFYDIDLMRQQKGFHIITMQEFLAKEGLSILSEILDTYLNYIISHLTIRCHWRSA